MSGAAELRILSGCHAGARAALVGGEQLGPGDDCDLVLSDLGLPEGASAWIGLAARRWWVRSEPAEPTGSNASDNPPSQSSDWVADTAWDEVVFLGQVAMTVSAPDAPWQSVPAGLKAAERLQSAEEPAAPGSFDPEPPPSAKAEPAANALVAAVPAAVADRAVEAVGRRSALERAPTDVPARRWHPAWIIGAAFSALLLSVLWTLLQGRESARIQTTEEPSEATLAGEATAQQQRLMSDIQLAIARVDPTLRLRVEQLPAGGSRVSGWVADIAQLDRLADGLTDIRPRPALAVRTASELVDDLVDASGADGPAVRFELVGEGRVRALGLVSGAEERDKVLASVRARLPPGIEIVDGLRVASEQGGAVQDWLRTAGFPSAQALWADGQMVIGLDISRQERARLEALLARAATPLSGIPFVLRTREIAHAVAQPVAKVFASAAPLPFRIRSVVSGPMPYVVLGDGSKLQPGGRQAGWRLVAVESDRLVFDGPRSLEVLR
jgi:type III secretion protein D